MTDFKIMRIIFSACLLFVSTFSFAQKVYNIRDYGAISDGKTVTTKAIQKAIDTCSNTGGGTVYIPTGTFVTGAIQLKSRVHLKLESGAVLKGSRQVSDYLLNGFLQGMFFGEDITDVTISGDGLIDGNGTSFFDATKLHDYIDFDKKYIRQGQAYLDALKPVDGPILYKSRPGMLMVIMHSENIKITGVKIIDSPNWTIRIGNCQDVLVDGITITSNPLVPNSDGLHITISRNVRIANCNIEAGDDALIVSGLSDEIDTDNRPSVSTKKVYQYGNKTNYAENVVATNCVLKSFSSGIRVGYGSGNIRNVIFSNMVIYNSNRGILINARESGSIDNVLFENFTIETKHIGGTWWGRGEPVHISSVRIFKDSINGTISNITMRNLKIKAETGIVVWASEMGKVRDLTFDGIDVKIYNSPKVELFGGNIDLRPTADFSTNIFKRDLPAILFHQIENVKINDVETSFIGTAPLFYTNGLEVNQSRNFKITSSNFVPSNAKFSPIYVNQSKGINFDNKLGVKVAEGK